MKSTPVSKKRVGQQDQIVVGSMRALCELLERVPKGSLYRHNDAGDLPALGRRHRYAFTNQKQHKTGRAYRSRTSLSSCPAACEMLGTCYAFTGPIRMHWEALGYWAKKGADALDWRATIKLASSCGRAELVAWTYTHWPWKRYARTFARSTSLGLTINVSVSSPAEAVRAHRAGLPVALVAPPDLRKNLVLDGVKAALCPAFTQGMTCDTCGGSSGIPLCARKDAGRFIIMFPCHGARRRSTWESIESRWKGYV